MNSEEHLQFVSETDSILSHTGLKLVMIARSGLNLTKVIEFRCLKKRVKFL